MTATLDGLIATGATFEAIVDAATDLGYHLKERHAKPPKVGAVFVDSGGRIQRIRRRWLGWVMSVDGESRVSVFRWASRGASAMVLEPEAAAPDPPVQWFALTLVVVARLLLVMLTGVLLQLEVAMGPLWVLTALILAAATYTSITLIHRAQWPDLLMALDVMAPDWIPRLSRDVGGRRLAIATIVGMAGVDLMLDVSEVVWIVVLGFVVLDVMPTRHFRQARALTTQPKVLTRAHPARLARHLKWLLSTQGVGVTVLTVRRPETLLDAAEHLVDAGESITVLGPDAEFLPGTLRSNFAWDVSEVADYHFANLMQLVGLPHWRERFGGSLEYQIGPHNQGLSSSEAACLQIARALAQGAETLVLVDALAPLSAMRQRQILDNLGQAQCRILVYSSVSDCWEDHAVELD
jgi:hypothetical protein